MLTNSTNITQNDPLDSFTDREKILAQFEQFLQSAQTHKLRLFAIKGNSGIGKTFLISYLAERICPKFNVQSGQIFLAHSRPDFRSILTGLEDALKQSVPSKNFNRYLAQCEKYNRLFDEYQNTNITYLSIEANNGALIAGANQSVQVNAQLHEREMQLRAELSNALMELAKGIRQPLCLFIDGYERLAEGDSELVGWLWEDIFPRLVRAASKPLQVVTCGWEWPGNPSVRPFAQLTELTDFDLQQVRSYLEKQGVIDTSKASSPSVDEEILTAFYNLTSGHPLVLGLAVTYYNEFDSYDRNAHFLNTSRAFIEERTQVEFLQERLLERLSEPYRTLLERGPILRFLSQEALYVLLNDPVEDSAAERIELDDRSYDRFLRYPFVDRPSRSDNDSSMVRPIFHEMIRRVGLSALRRHHPQTKEQLHRRMVDYYEGLADPKQEYEWISAFVHTTRTRPENSSARNPIVSSLLVRIGLRNRQPPAKGSSNINRNRSTDYAMWLKEVSEQKFSIVLEMLYHALQVEEYQTYAFSVWENLISYAENGWHRQKAKLLLEVVRQLIEEGERFLSPSSDPYGKYLLYYSLFILQESRWEDAKTELEQAVEIFEQVGNISDLSTCLESIGRIYQQLGRLDEALNYSKRSLDLSKRGGKNTDIAISLSNLGTIYFAQGNLKESLKFFKRALSFSKKISDYGLAIVYLNNMGSVYIEHGKLNGALSYFKQALSLAEKVDNPLLLAQSYHNMGFVHRRKGKLEEALNYYKRALEIFERMGYQPAIATTLDGIGGVYNFQEDLGKALSYYERSLQIKEQVGNPSEIAGTLNNMGEVLQKQGNLEKALSHHKRALNIREQVGNPAHIAQSLNNIGFIYYRNGKLDKALHYYEQSLSRREQIGNPDEIANSLNNISYIYVQQEKLEQAMECLRRALILYKQAGNRFGTAVCLHHIGLIYQAQQNWRIAITFRSEAFKLFDDLGRGFEAKAADQLEGLAICYAQLGDAKKSSNYQSRAKQIRDKMQKAG